MAEALLRARLADVDPSIEVASGELHFEDLNNGRVPRAKPTKFATVRGTLFS